MSDDNEINLKVKGNSGETFFKIKMSTPLAKVMDAYCAKTGQLPSTVRFLTNGDRISPTDTPASLGFEDHDVIDALVEQVGG
ncbi:ubiquitin-like protein [Streptomyces sp. NPDC048696]|uniref:ubiquitin-like protein n=1 Tax=Streptomyces sp. NPDC048696 TaxID=3365585 RepID=UPI00371E4F73